MLRCEEADTIKPGVFPSTKTKRMTSEASQVSVQETGDMNTLGHTTTVGQAVVLTSSNNADGLGPVQEVGGSAGLGPVQEVGGSVGVLCTSAVVRCGVQESGDDNRVMCLIHCDVTLV